jgi:uncharacterized lipoprotein
MRSNIDLVAGALAIVLVTACSNEPPTSTRDEANRHSAADHKSDAAEPVDAAGRTSDNAGKCIAGACADSSPPTSP